jgi:hypothetical protein
MFGTHVDTSKEVGLKVKKLSHYTPQRLSGGKEV